MQALMILNVPDQSVPCLICLFVVFFRHSLLLSTPSSLQFFLHPSFNTLFLSSEFSAFPISLFLPSSLPSSLSSTFPFLGHLIHSSICPQVLPFFLSHPLSPCLLSFIFFRVYLTTQWKSQKPRHAVNLNFDRQTFPILPVINTVPRHCRQ